jgi:hypothetical protein
MIFGSPATIRGFHREAKKIRMRSAKKTLLFFKYIFPSTWVLQAFIIISKTKALTQKEMNHGEVVTIQPPRMDWTGSETYIIFDIRVGI